MEKVIIRKVELKDLISIQKLNDNLFDLEFNNFDDTLKREWALEKEGQEYFEDMIKNEIVFVAQIEEKKVTASKNSRAIQFYMKNGFEDYNVTLKFKI